MKDITTTETRIKLSGALNRALHLKAAEEDRSPTDIVKEALVPILRDQGFLQRALDEIQANQARGKKALVA